MFRDGPLTRSAPETIRYGTGRCALGALLVASSERGIVSIMVRDTQARLTRDLGARFPKANLVRDEKGCKATVASSCSRSWFAFAVPCHRVLHTGHRRDGRQYDWVDYESRLAAKRRRLVAACRGDARLGRWQSKRKAITS